MDRNFCGESCNSWFVNKTNKEIILLKEYIMHKQ